MEAEDCRTYCPRGDVSAKKSSKKNGLTGEQTADKKGENENEDLQ